MFITFDARLIRDFDSTMSMCTVGQPFTTWLIATRGDKLSNCVCPPTIRGRNGETGVASCCVTGQAWSSESPLMSSDYGYIEADVWVSSE